MFQLVVANLYFNAQSVKCKLKLPLIYLNGNNIEILIDSYVLIEFYLFIAIETYT